MTKIITKALVRNSEGLYLVLHRGNTHPRSLGILIFLAERLSQKKRQRQQ